MIIYADTSFIVSLYVTDVHSLDARKHIARVPNLVFTILHRAEWAHALAKHEFWGNISAEQAKVIDARFSSDYADGLWRDTAMPELAFDLCTDLARRHVAKLGVRTLDTLHVACALELKADQFWTFDERQNKLARTVGLKVT